MKLIIAGATGFVGQELVKQALGKPEITTVVAISRRPLSAAQGAGDAKLRSVLVKDYDDYPEFVRQEFAGANACVWTVAVTPGKAQAYGFAEVKRICQTSTMEGFRAMHSAGLAKPFRFLYMCGKHIDRNVEKHSWIVGKYGDMRAETERQVLAFAAENQMEACVTKTGLITGPGYTGRNLFANMMDFLGVDPAITVQTLSAAILDQVVNGFEKEPLVTEDLLRIGKRAMQVPTDKP